MAQQLEDSCNSDETHREALRDAVKQGNAALVRRLVDEFKLDVNQADAVGWTPLFLTPLLLAALGGHEAVVRLLVKECGANVNQASANNITTPLLTAAFNGHEAVVRLLVKEYGANVNQADAKGATPLHWAVQNGHEAVVRLLIKECGADMNQANASGWTPLHIAAYNGEDAMARLLFKECGANVNQADAKGATPLHWAAQNGREAVVRMLVHECGAEVNQAGANGETPLCSAARNGYTSVTRYLINVAGADAHVLCSGRSVADTAARSGYPVTMRELLWLGVSLARPADLRGDACIVVWQRFQHSQRVAECVYQLCLTDVLRHELFSVQAFHPIVQLILDYTTTTPPRLKHHRVRIAMVADADDNDKEDGGATMNHRN